jgi:hypothetical protein
MAGMGRIIGGSPRWKALAASLALSALWGAAPAFAAPSTFTVHTSRGGTCRIHTVASRAGTQVTYGVRVKQCQTKFGVRYAVSQGVLYDEDKGNQPVSTGYLGRKKGHLPYGHQRTISNTSPSHTYRTRVDLSIVLKTRRNPRTRNLERWTHSGKHCRVKSTRRQADTLGCEFSVNLPAP